MSRDLRSPKPIVSDTRRVRLSTLCEVLCAAHLSSYVESPIADRSGVMLVAPPGALKTSAVRIVDRSYANALAYSNLNTKTLMRLRTELIAGTMRSIVLPDLQAVYAGDPRTADRLEHALMQLSAEGSVGASWEDSRFQRFESRATIIGAMPYDFFHQRVEQWEPNGFFRRFVWFFYALDRPEAINEALVRWERVRLNGLTVIPQVPADTLAMTLTEGERRELLFLLKDQPGPKEAALVMLSRIATVLRWHYQRIGNKHDAMDTIREFACGLGPKSARLVL
jgi:hypothetical protein